MTLRAPTRPGGCARQAETEGVNHEKFVGVLLGFFWVLEQQVQVHQSVVSRCFGATRCLYIQVLTYKRAQVANRTLFSRCVGPLWCLSIHLIWGCCKPETKVFYLIPLVPTEQPEVRLPFYLLPFPRYSSISGFCCKPETEEATPKKSFLYDSPCSNGAARS